MSTQRTFQHATFCRVSLWNFPGWAPNIQAALSCPGLRLTCCAKKKTKWVVRTVCQTQSDGCDFCVCSCFHAILRCVLQLQSKKQANEFLMFVFDGSTARTCRHSSCSSMEYSKSSGVGGLQPRSDNLIVMASNSTLPLYSFLHLMHTENGNVSIQLTGVVVPRCRWDTRCASLLNVFAVKRGEVHWPWEICTSRASRLLTFLLLKTFSFFLS